MERFLASLERRFGRLPLPNLVHALIGATGIVFALMFVSPRPLLALILDPDAIARGQVWRLVTHVLIPSSEPRGFGLLFMLFWVGFLWTVGTSLENEWGRFKTNFYVLSLVIGTTVAALLTGMPTSSMIVTSMLVLAFATLFPEYEIMLYGIVPLRMKWLALLDAGYLGWMAFKGPLPVRATIGAAAAVYLLFFYANLARIARGGATMAAAAQRRAERRAEPVEAATRPKRQCVTCGLTDDDEGADLRVCTCAEVCGGKPTVYCLAHARSHRKPAT
jgi:hypothetical protein